MKRLFYLATATMFMVLSCTGPADIKFSSDFSLLDPEKLAEKEKQLGIMGGSARISRKPVEAGGAVWKISEDMLHLDFESHGYFSFTPVSVGLPASWKGTRSLRIVAFSEEPTDILVEIYGSRSRIRDTLTLTSDKSQFEVDIREVPLIGGITSEPDRIRITSEDPSVVTIESILLTENTRQEFLVDRWGQRAHGTWEGKIRNEEQFLDMGPENRFLDSLVASSTIGALDRYGGYSNRILKFEGTGYFRTQLHQGKWWLVTPEGNPFYSLGVNGVRIKSFRSNADVTLLDGRETLFEHVPDYRECPVCFRVDSSYFSFYSWNISRKYTDILAWKHQTEKRLRSSGFNTIGNWSDTLYYLEPTMPYTYTLDTRKDPGFVMSNGMPDVFHPEWEQHLKTVTAGISRFREDPYLLGYFVDNEMHWGALVNRPDSASHTFQELNALESEYDIRSAYAERYFSSVAEAIRNSDPNHMYMGCRFTRNFRNMEAIARAAGRHMDVLSINVYSPPRREQMDQWFEAVGLPMLIGEHHIPPRTGRQLWPRYPNFPLDERDKLVEDYVFSWIEYPYSLGSHWYQYKDQEVAGRNEGGENQPVGLVTIADQPNFRLLSLFHKISNNLPKRMGLKEDPD